MYIAQIIRAAAELGRHFATTPTGGVERKDAIVDVIVYTVVQHHLMTAWGRVAWSSRATALAAAAELARDNAATVRQWRQLASQALYVMRGCAPHGLTPDAA